MIILDANILLYAYDSASSHHNKAREWLERTLSSGVPIGLPWQTITAFLRIMTNSRLPGERFTPAEVIDIIQQWLQRPNIRLLAPSDDHWPLLCQMITEGQAQGPLISNAHVAALSMEYGGVLYTTDRDFARFPKLRWKNPLE